MMALLKIIIKWNLRHVAELILRINGYIEYLITIYGVMLALAVALGF